MLGSQEEKKHQEV